MGTTPLQPREALEPDDYQRFMYACAHERRSPSTQRLIDASSYGWVYRFITEHGEEADTPPTAGDGWLDPHDANPRMLGEYFGRVAVRVRRTGALDYATSLERYFNDIADSRGLP